MGGRTQRGEEKLIIVETQITQCTVSCPSKYDIAVLWYGQWFSCTVRERSIAMSRLFLGSPLSAQPSPAQETGLILLGFSLILLAS